MSMGNNIQILNSFSMTTNKPVDDRELVATMADLINIPVYKVYMGMQVYVEENNTRFKWVSDHFEIEHLGFCSGAGTPDNDDYSAGDMYIDTLTGDLYYKKYNTDDNTISWEFQVNIKGPKGDIGDEGIRGVRGTYWYTGNAITGQSETPTAFPDSGITSAEVNDMYINNSGEVYKCTVSGSPENAMWVYTGILITGPQGEKGTYIYSGTGLLGTVSDTGTFIIPPDETQLNFEVNAGDMYLNSEYGHLYSTLESGLASEVEWKRVGVIEGSKIYTGSVINGAEDSSAVYANTGIDYANVGDLYMSMATACIYVCTTEGTESTAVWDYAMPIGNIFTGSTDVDNGIPGLVPAPSAGEDNRFLSVDGSWKIVDTDLSAEIGTF